ncbi:hypothetical protein Tco_0856410 [Tanacetum coccineum]|uniref:Uncharacterized protein n=1 Tax=Tanacetum coccineum TaxID=301880 RepID=A0ABQ5B4D3_9ASTR
MSKALMPCGGTCRGEKAMGGKLLDPGNWIEITRVVTSKEDMTSQNIMKMKWAMMGRNNAMACVSDGNRLAITNVNRWK